MSEDDPSSIRSLAVASEDVVDAAVYSRENPGTAVLRVTPPFHGRMRARLHVYHGEDGRVSDAIHLAPDELLEDEVVEAYPSFDDRLGDAEAADPDRVGARRERALERWRDRAANAIVESVALEAGDGTEADGTNDPDEGDGRHHRVDLKRLG